MAWVRWGMLLCFLGACSGRTSGASSSSSSSGGGETADAGGGGPAAGTLGGPCTVSSGCDGGSCEATLSSEPVTGGVCVGTGCTAGQDCLGGAGRCLASTVSSQCVLKCAGAGGCTRPGFSCFQVSGTGMVCLPSTVAQCVPSTGAGCSGGESCVLIGPDDVGTCQGACHPETQDCPGNPDAGLGCYFNSAGSFCAAPLNPQPDYAPCATANACAAGRACIQVYDVARCYFTCDPAGALPRCPVGNCQPLFGAHLCVPPEMADAGP
jgi:hypothetical protein